VHGKPHSKPRCAATIYFLAFCDLTHFVSLVTSRCGSAHESKRATQRAFMRVCVCACAYACACVFFAGWMAPGRCRDQLATPTAAGTAFKRSWAAGSMHTQIARSWTAAQNLREVGRAIRSPYLPLVHSAVFTSNVVNRTPIECVEKTFFLFFSSCQIEPNLLRKL
jgi:hypothetical protein